MSREGILAAMRADGIPAGTSGRWTVVKRRVDKRLSQASLKLALLNKENAYHAPYVEAGTYTWLHCLTTETMMNPPGEVVMNDYPDELCKHLEFIMVATGRVLVGGLGLGCVVRGLLARGAVEHIDIIERSTDVIRLCGDALLRDRRVTIHQRDALHGFIHGGPWDYAWWDLWNDPEKSEPHLQIIHMDLISRFADRVKHRQGAWAMPRQHRRPLREIGVML